MPSGRRTPSTLMTSAPSDAEHLGGHRPGPKRGEVGHPDVRTAEGRRGRRGPCRFVGPRQPVHASAVGAQRPEASPAGGAMRVAAVRHPGLQDSARRIRRTRRARRSGRPFVTDAGVPMGATGMRNATARSTISSVVRVCVHRVTMARNSSRRSTRPATDAKLGVVEQVRPIDQHQEVLKLLSGDGAEADHAVGRRHDRR